MKLGELIHMWRVVNELPLRDIANAIGISHSTLARLESGRNIDGRALIKVLNWVLECKPEAVTR